jgi:hypothetical protein
VNGKNKRWLEQRWDKRQPERLKHIQAKQKRKENPHGADAEAKAPDARNRNPRLLRDSEGKSDSKD